MVEIACGATLSLVYERLLSQAITNLTEQSTIVLIICGGTFFLSLAYSLGASVTVDSLVDLESKYGP